jgi:hypothetical protein
MLNSIFNYVSNKVSEIKSYTQENLLTHKRVELAARVCFSSLAVDLATMGATRGSTSAIKSFNICLEIPSGEKNIEELAHPILATAAYALVTSLACAYAYYNFQSVYITPVKAFLS